MLKGKKIALGVTASIAAYKAAELLRELQKKGADVWVALTPKAKDFASEQTLSVLSKHSVYSDRSSVEIRHTTISAWADAFLVAPATANTIAKMAHGIADNPVANLALCFGRGIVCPAMNHRMYENPITQENIEILRKNGYVLVGPEVGYLACNETGKGRLASIDDIVTSCEYYFMPKLLNGKKVVITAGPTREYIDPIRFISNPSSGKMGFAIAKVARGMGAHVVLISGKTSLATPYGVKRIDVETVDEMKDAVISEVNDADVLVSTAAVNDYKPLHVSKQKLKKGEPTISLTFQRTADILKTAGLKKKKGQIFIGFAAETQNLIENARKKMVEKNLDGIVANDVGTFGSDEANVTFILRGKLLKLNGRKESIALDIMKIIAKENLDV